MSNAGALDAFLTCFANKDFIEVVTGSLADGDRPTEPRLATPTTPASSIAAPTQPKAMPIGTPPSTTPVPVAPWRLDLPPIPPPIAQRSADHPSPIPQPPPIPPIAKASTSSEIPPECKGKGKGKGDRPPPEVMMYYAAERDAASAAHVRWQQRGPPGPYSGGPEFWRGQTFRQGSGRWANRGGTNRSWYATFHRAITNGASIQAATQAADLVSPKAPPPQHQGY